MLLYELLLSFFNSLYINLDLSILFSFSNLYKLIISFKLYFVLYLVPIFIPPHYSYYLKITYYMFSYLFNNPIKTSDCLILAIASLICTATVDLSIPNFSAILS